MRRVGTYGRHMTVGVHFSDIQSSCVSWGVGHTATPKQTWESIQIPPLKKSHPDDVGSETSFASFPPLKPLAEVMPCYPSKDGSFHETGIP